MCIVNCTPHYYCSIFGFCGPMHNINAGIWIGSAGLCCHPFTCSSLTGIMSELINVSSKLPMDLVLFTYLFIYHHFVAWINFIVATVKILELVNRNERICIFVIDYLSVATVCCACALCCLSAVDECAAGPCQNGGTCVNGFAKYTCICQGSFTGVNCTRSK